MIQCYIKKCSDFDEKVNRRNILLTLKTAEVAVADIQSGRPALPASGSALCAVFEYAFRCWTDHNTSYAIPPTNQVGSHKLCHKVRAQRYSRRVRFCLPGLGLYSMILLFMFLSFRFQWWKAGRAQKARCIFIAVCVFYAQATSANWISLMCCLNVALISWLAIIGTIFWKLR